MNKFCSKILLALSAIILTLSLSACESENDNNPENEIMGNWECVETGEITCEKCNDNHGTYISTYTFDTAGNFIDTEYWKCPRCNNEKKRTEYGTYEYSCDKHGKITRYFMYSTYKNNNKTYKSCFFVKGDKMIEDWSIEAFESNWYKYYTEKNFKNHPFGIYKKQ